VTLATLMGCGSSGGEGGRNVLPVTVGAGPANVAPGTSNCQTIDGVQIDTGSTGLRILASALTLTLLGQTDASGNAIAECEMFSDALPGDRFRPLMCSSAERPRQALRCR
jgi:uncharacterized protein DUF3443